jgi:enoyl-CoA hydratase
MPPVEIELEAADGLAVITLNAPERRNALTPEMAVALSEALAEVEGNPEVGALIVEGAGGYFCAGATRDTLAAAAEDPAGADAVRGLSAVYRAFTDLARLSVPTIAAVRGGAVGAGLNLALAADVRIVSTDAKLLSGFLRIGVHPGGGHFQLLERLVGPERTVAMTILGMTVDGATAAEWGLALEAVADSAVAGRCRELAGRVRDPELARAAMRTFRGYVESHGIPSSLAVQAEQAPQMWSLRRSLKPV